MVSPIRANAFFKQAVFQREIGNALLQRARFAAQILHLTAGGGTGGVARKAALAMSPVQ